jgi:hypothetical protein
MRTKFAKYQRNQGIGAVALYRIGAPIHREDERGFAGGDQSPKGTAGAPPLTT